MSTPPDLWTIDELAARAAVVLSAGDERVDDGRIRDVPDTRTIRYYTTLGLLDRPAEMRGRTALYGRRHLAQLVAIKRFQARGLTLSQVQERLVGLTPAALARLAAVPEDAGAAAAATPRAEPAPRREQFWAEAPAAVPAPSSPATTAASLEAVPLTADVLLLFAPVRSLDDDDRAALRVAAAPVLKLLESRRLLWPRP